MLSISKAFLVAFSIAVAVRGTQDAKCDVAAGERKDCGLGQQQQCEGAGCCWQPVNPNPGNLPWCFLKNGPAPAPGPAPPPGPLPTCQIFSGNHCDGNQIHTERSFEANRWYTPLKGEKDYQQSFQDYAKLVAFAHVVYTDATLSSASLAIVATHKDPSMKLSYVFGGKEQTSNQAKFDKTQTTPLDIVVKGSDGSKITLEPVDFRWNAPAVKPRDGDFRGGQKGAIAELFGWPHAEIEAECADLAAMGYLGVKVFPVMEQLMSTEPFQNFLNPWYFMYQPVSYRLQGRMGTRDDLRKMIHTCRSLGVRVYADAVVNHMAGGGNDANPYHRNPQAGCAKWGNKSSSLAGGHSPSYTQSYTYTTGKHTGKQPLQEFPAVPYGPLDFHCERSLSSWNDPLQLNAGWLSGLTDLDTERDNVQERIAAYFTDLIGIGFSGFRVDAAKHIQPEDLVAIFGKFKRNLGGALPEDFFTYFEVLLGGEADMLMCNGGSDYNYGSGLVNKLAKAGFTKDEINKIKIWNSGYPKEPEKGIADCDIGKSGTQRVVIQNDDHDQQNPGSSSRDMQNAGCVLIKGCAEATHRAFEVELFTNPPGSTDNKNDYPIRSVLSSFYWGANGVQGMPDGKSSCDLCTVNCDTCKSMGYQKAHDPTSKGYDKGDGKYTRAHRDAAVTAAIRKWMDIGDDGALMITMPSGANAAQAIVV